VRSHFSTPVTVVNGKLKLLDKDGYALGLKQFLDGQALELHIEEESRKRTSAQNRFFHGPVLAAFQSLGLGQQEAKDMLCLRFIPRECRQLDGSIVLVPGHTSDLDVSEFNALIDECIQLAAENDVHVKDGAEWRASHQGRQLQET